ncbi:MAG: hypothetical protein ACYDAY_06505 [Candidatus Dormibacteria bacterium]
MRGRWAALASVVFLAIPGAASARAAAIGPSCAWDFRFDPNVANVAFPDTVANYWFLELPAVPGETLTLQGRYPHARYISYTTYDAQTAAIDGVNDQAIQPDPGSVNPFLAGADRTSSERDYTVTAVYGQRPSGGPSNTVYTTSADGSHSADAFVLVYRVYRVDQPYQQMQPPDITGGAGLPEVTVNIPGAPPSLIPDCPAHDAPETGVNQQVANQGTASTLPLVYPGQSPPIWHKFYNLAASFAYSTDNGYTGSALSEQLVPLAERRPSGGFIQNLDNAYIFTFLNRAYGSGPEGDSVVVVRAKAPTFADTFGGTATMPTAGQLRYWSLCSDEGLSQRVFGCLTDDQAILDAFGYFTLVLSTPADRPATADSLHGVNWLPFGPANDNVLILRNMLPESQSAFPYAVQYVDYGHEQDMGAYFPMTCYLTSVQFDHGGGC